jgi:CRP-like cAMP-binding protein
MQILQGEHVIRDLGLNYFKAGSTFGALSDQGLRYLLTQGKVLQLNSGECLYEPGERGDRFYVILKGSVAFYKHHRDRNRYVSNHKFGEELGFVSMIALHNRVGMGEAAEDSLVLEVSSDLFYDFHETFPADFGVLLLNLSREMARRLRKFSNMLVDNDIEH